MLNVSDLTYRLGARLLLDQASFSLPNPSRVGLVGRNGIGKTTLFRLIVEEIAAESGSISLPKNTRIGRVEQEAPGGPQSLLDFVLAADTERVALLEEAETAMDPERIGLIQMRLADIGAHSAPARAGAILHGLGFEPESQLRPCSDFSGGWRMRAALAAILFTEPDLLLLDEPTNYLDLEGALWLEQHLKRYPRTAIIISHDRDFLDEVTDHTLHLAEGKLNLYKGGYSSFEKQRAAKAEQAGKMAEKQADERAHLIAFIERFKAKASKAKQAQSRVKRLEKLQFVESVATEQAAKIHLPDPVKMLSPPLLTFDNVSTGYGERVVLKRLNLAIAEDDRIGLIGSNGNGKSTFVKLIAGKIAAMAGDLRRAPKLSIAYFAQHQLEELDEKATPYSLMAARLVPKGPHIATDTRIRGSAAQLGFGADKVETPIANLSGGEKARLLLGLAAFDGPHLLILDEPTNHLDIPMRQALVEALSAYKGAVLIVSHDRYLLEACCDRLWLVANGTLTNFDGDIEDYAKFITQSRSAGESKTSENEGKTSAADERRREADKRASLQPLRKKLSQLEEQIEKLGALLEKADAMLAAPDLFTKSPQKATQLAKDRAALAEKIAATEEEWLELGAEIEAAANA